MTIIHLQARESVDAAETGGTTGVDISPSTYNFSSSTPPNELIVLAVYGLDAGGTAVFSLQDSVNAFTAYVTHRSWTVVGPVGATSNQGDQDDDEGESTSFPVNPVYFSVSWRDVPAIRWGTSSAVLRLCVASITSTHYVDYEAWFQY